MYMFVISFMVFVLLDIDKWIQLVKDIKQFNYEENLPIEERMRIRGIQ